MNTEAFLNQWVPPATIPAVDLEPRALLHETHTRAYPLRLQDRTRPLLEIAPFLDVETSQRYQPTPQQTFCNIYAYDYANLAGAYLPRVWWTGAAIARLHAGETVAPEYGETVFEMNANLLFFWLAEYGADFGWRRVASIDELRAEAANGKLCVISATNKPKLPGHISILLGSSTEQLLQSQAGRRNYRSSAAPGSWWLHLAAWGFFVHDPPNIR